MELTDIRSRIDDIDDKMVSLFLERMRCSEMVAKVKIEKNLPVLSEKRENEIIERLCAGKNAEDARAIEALYRKIFEISRSRQTLLMERA